TALPVYAAVDKGFFAAEGIDLRVIKVQGSHTVATLITGEIQFAIIGTTAITARLNGAPLKVIACTLARPFQWPRDRPVGSLERQDRIDDAIRRRFVVFLDQSLTGKFRLEGP